MFTIALPQAKNQDNRIIDSKLSITTMLAVGVIYKEQKQDKQLQSEEDFVGNVAA